MHRPGVTKIRQTRTANWFTCYYIGPIRLPGKKELG